MNVDRPDRYRFFIHREDGDVLVGMDFDGVVRTRHMPETFLEDLSTVCRRMRLKAVGVLRKQKPSDIPVFPGFRSVVTATMGDVCTLTLGAHRLGRDTVEQVLAVYD